MSDHIDFAPTEQIFTSLPGETGVFPGIVMFSFTSPYDSGVYYIIRMDQTVRDKRGQPWETFEVRSRWQLTRNAKETPLYYESGEKLDAASGIKKDHRHVEGSDTDFRALDPAAEIAYGEDNPEDED